MILVREIRKSYGRVHAVRGVSLAVEPGEIVGLLGPNGAGKSTTIRMITGYIAPDSGTVTIDGADSRSDSRGARERIGYLPESAPLYPEMSVGGYLDYRARLFGLGRADRRRAVGSAMDRCRVREVRRRRIGHLSKGYRQRVGLATALLHDPPVLVLDEPSNGLDPSQIRETRSLVRELAEKRTMIVCSHILPEVERLCTRVVIIAGGLVRADRSLSGGGGSNCRAEVRGGDIGALIETIRGIDGVERVDRSDGGEEWVVLRVRTGSGAADPREAIAAAAAARGVGLRALEPDGAGLEQLFIETIESAAVDDRVVSDGGAA